MLRAFHCGSHRFVCPRVCEKWNIPAIIKATTYCVYLCDSSAVEGLWPDLNRSRNFSLVSSYDASEHQRPWWGDCGHSAIRQSLSRQGGGDPLTCKQMTSHLVKLLSRQMKQIFANIIQAHKQENVCPSCSPGHKTTFINFIWSRGQMFLQL